MTARIRLKKVGKPNAFKHTAVDIFRMLLHLEKKLWGFTGDSHNSRLVGGNRCSRITNPRTSRYDLILKI